MVVYYSHVPSIFSIPSKAYPPLVIDTNAVLTVPVPRKGFEMVPWGIPQVHQAFSTDSGNFLTLRRSATASVSLSR